MKWVLSLVLFGSFTTAVLGDELDIGDEVPINHSDSVRVHAKIANTNHMFERGEECRVEKGAKWIVQSFYPGKKWALVRYVLKEKASYGDCPDGTLSKRLSSELVDAIEEAAALVREEQAERGLVVDLLKSASRAKDTRIVPESSWVIVRNLRGSGSWGMTRAYGESCILKQGRTVTWLGLDAKSDRILCRYTRPKNTWGTECLHGTILFLARDYFEALSRN